MKLNPIVPARQREECNSPRRSETKAESHSAAKPKPKCQPFNAEDAKVDAEDAEQWLHRDFGDYLCLLCENLRALCV